MAKSKVEMLDEMKFLAGRMEPAMKLTKLEEIRLIVPEHSEKLRADFIRPGYKWIQAIHDNEFQEVVRARQFCDEDVWEMYEILGEEDLVEVKDLRKALFAFRMAVVSRKRPNYYKVTKRTKLLDKVAR